jgi:hypothetical protein
MGSKLEGGMVSAPAAAKASSVGAKTAVEENQIKLIQIKSTM